MKSRVLKLDRLGSVSGSDWKFEDNTEEDKSLFQKRSLSNKYLDGDKVSDRFAEKVRSSVKSYIAVEELNKEENAPCGS